MRMILCRYEKQFFFEKKNQKTFVNLAPGCAAAVAQIKEKFFASFFQKRRAFLLQHI
jgi:hypothetical protein